MNYQGTPLESDYEKLQRRRKLYEAMMGQALQPTGQTEVISGHAIPNLGSGISKIGQAILAKKGLASTDESGKALDAKYSQARQGSIQKLIDTLATNKDQAAIMAGTDPYLQNNDLAKALLTADAYKARAGGTPYFAPIYGKGGEVYGHNRRTNEVTPLELPDVGQIEDPRYNQDARFGIKQAEQMGTGTAEAVTDPVTAQRVRQAESNVDLQMKPKIKKETMMAERAAEKAIDRPKIESTLSQAETKTGMLGGLIAKAKDQASVWTTGFIGNATEWVPGTPSHDLGKTLQTIKANVGFDKLQEMKDSSPHGGALGQVSEFENRLLQAVWGALEQSQSKEQFLENLDLVEKQTQESWQRIRDAYEKDYGKPYEEVESAESSEGWTDDKERRLQELRQKLGK